MSLISLFCLVDFGVTAVLGRNWCGYDARVDDSATVQSHATRPWHDVDGVEELLSQVMLFQQMTEPQDTDPIRQSSVCVQPCKLGYSGVSNKATPVAKSIRPKS